MKKIFLLISAILLIVPVQAQHTLRLMTYNIKNATGMDGVCDFQRIANVINNASPEDRKSTRLNSSHANESRMPSSA